MNFEHIPVNAHLIHKEHLDDVLVSNIRAELPNWLSKDVLEAEWLSEADRNLLSTHYALDTTFCASSNDEMVFVRRSAVTFLPESLAQEEGFEWAVDYYKPAANGWVLNAKYLPEHLEEALAARLHPRERRLSPATRHRISKLTERIPCNMRSHRYAMTMINDLQNYFFYRKHHEHVPGIMLIEVARQAIYAQTYLASSHRRGEVTLSIKTLNCTFKDYVDSNYPVTVVVDTHDVPEDVDNTVFERRTARFYQRGRIVAEIDIVGAPIKMNLFKRLRAVKPQPGDWFAPIKGFAPSVLFSDGGGKRIEGKLRRISENGMDLVFREPPQETALLDFVISIEGIGYVDGKAQVRMLEDVPEGVKVLMNLCDLNRDSKRKWLDAIKNYTHVEPMAEV